MFDRFLAPGVSATLFGISAYFITQSKSCPCPEVDETKRSYILGFSYVGIAYALFSFALGSSVFQMFLKYPLLALAPVLFMIGLIAYAILIIQYTYTLKACKCEATVAEKITYTVAVLQLVVASIATLAAGYGIYQVASLSSADRKLYLSIAKNILTKSAKSSK